LNLIHPRQIYSLKINYIGLIISCQQNYIFFIYENLESDFKKIKNILDIPYNPRENLMLFNYSRIKSSIEMLTKLQKARIFNIFNEEFKTFGYNK